MTHKNPFPKGTDFLAAELDAPDRAFKRADARLTPAVASSAPPVKRELGSRGRRLVSWQASIALHAATVVLWLALPHPSLAPPIAKPPLEEPIPVEVAFEPIVTQPAAKKAPPAPAKLPVPQPVPKAPDVPERQIDRQKAAAIKPLPPKPAVRQAAPAARPAQKAFEQPKAPDLNAALQARLNQGKAQEEQRLSDLRDKARDGAPEAPDRPAAGSPQGNPTTSTSGLSGSLASRGLLGRVAPSYPMSAQRAGAEGTVVVRVYVGATGRVSRTEVTQSSGFISLDRAAAVAASQWSFTPLDGEKQQWGDIPFHFKL